MQRLCRATHSSSDSSPLGKLTSSSSSAFLLRDDMMKFNDEARSIGWRICQLFPRGVFRCYNVDLLHRGRKREKKGKA